MTSNLKPLRILCFGDSLTYGAWDTEGGWVDLLKRHYHSKFIKGGNKIQVYNLGIGGETSLGLLQRIEQEIQARKSMEWEVIIIIATGKNDTRAKDKPDNFESDLKTYHKNLNEIITISKRYSKKILLIGFGAVNETLSFKNLYYSNERIKLFDEINQEIAHRNNIPRIDLYNQMIENSHFNDIYIDRVHPNSLGHKWLFKKILPEIDKLIK